MANGKLGSVNIPATTNTLLFTAAAVQTINIRFANRGTNPVKIRLAIGTGASPALEDYLSYDVVVFPNAILEETGLVISSGEKVWVWSDVATVSVRVHGV